MLEDFSKIFNCFRVEKIKILFFFGPESYWRNVLFDKVFVRSTGIDIVSGDNGSACGFCAF